MEAISDKEVTIVELRIKSEPETITAYDDLENHQSTGDLIMKCEENLDAIETFDSPTCVKNIENVPFKIKNQEEFPDEEEFQDEEFMVDDELLQIGKSPQSSNECEQYHNDVSNASELPGPSHVNEAEAQNSILKRKDPKESDELIAKWKPSLSCESCPKSFPTLTLLKSHFLVDHPKKDFYIMCCERKLKFRSRIEQHATLHMDPKAISCKLCDFTSYNNLKVHMAKFHSEPRNVSVREPATDQKWSFTPPYNFIEYYCRYCSCSFETEESWNQHMPSCPKKLGNLPRVMRCAFCLKTLTHRSGLYLYNKRIHSEEFAKRKREVTSMVQ
ncbi:transcription factor grauzone-like [Musca autumnalis]|uniref:transcription factor grauzone-like n=1 Tax=Musca autumnalis TaxID=221902 RepID=UPI003CF036C5